MRKSVRPRVATVDVVVPVPNDKRALSGYLKMLRSFLDDQSLAWRVIREFARSNPRVVDASASLLLPPAGALTACQVDREGVA